MKIRTVTVSFSRHIGIEETGVPFRQGAIGDERIRRLTVYSISVPVSLRIVTDRKTEADSGNCTIAVIPVAKD